MQTRRLLGAAAAALISVPLFGAEASAASRGAFIWDGEYWGFTYDAFEQGLTAGGATKVDRAPALPSDLLAYNLVIVVLPKVAPSSAESSTLASFVQGGGALVLVSDMQGYAPEPSPIFNALLPGLGVEARFAPGAVYSCGDTSAIEAHPLTAGLTAFHFAAPDYVVPGAATTPLVSTGDGNLFVAVEKNVVLLGDSNPINTFVCAPAEVNAPFFADLPAFACDVDGDGAMNASCDGSDPDDLDPSLTAPGGEGGSGAGGEGSGAAGGSSNQAGASPNGESGEGDGCSVASGATSLSKLLWLSTALFAIRLRRRSAGCRQK